MDGFRRHLSGTAKASRLSAGELPDSWPISRAAEFHVRSVGSTSLATDYKAATVTKLRSKGNSGAFSRPRDIRRICE